MAFTPQILARLSRFDSISTLFRMVSLCALRAARCRESAGSEGSSMTRLG
jgi:hypothetical protein